MTTTLPARAGSITRSAWPRLLPGGDPCQGRLISSPDGTQKVSSGRNVGAAWGAAQWSAEKIRQKFRTNPGAGVGLCLGPGKAPAGRWLMDLEGDEPQAADSLTRLLGGTVATMGWGSARGSHNLFVADTPDGERFLALLVKAKAEALKGEGKSGVWKLAELPDLEFRIGGYKSDGAVKQCQSVVPPTQGDNGQPREWHPGVTEPAELPEAAFTFRAEIAERNRSEDKATHASRNGDSHPPKIAPQAIGAPVEDRAIAYLATIEPAISGQNGSNKTFGAVCRVGPGVRSCNRTSHSALIRDHYNPRCVPPWSDAELAAQGRGCVQGRGAPRVSSRCESAKPFGALAQRIRASSGKPSDGHPHDRPAYRRGANRRGTTETTMSFSPVGSNLGIVVEEFGTTTTLPGGVVLKGSCGSIPRPSRGSACLAD